jgi:uncharacterized protein (DUF1919 family)
LTVVGTNTFANQAIGTTISTSLGFNFNSPRLNLYIWIYFKITLESYGKAENDLKGN